MLISFACMISSIFMGRLGAKELAAVSVSNTIIEIVQSLLIGLGIGATYII